MLQQGNALLVGDAAGLVDPMLGEGIRHAVDSGRLAADSVLNGRISGYTRLVHREIGTDLLWARRFWARVLYGHPWVSFELGMRNPLFLQEFVRLFAGHSSYRRMVGFLLPYIVRGIGHRLPA
jgi:flavin-dependent dehydrogenase